MIVVFAALTSFAYHLPHERIKLTHDIDVCFAYIAFFFTISIAFPTLSLFDYLFLPLLVAFGVWAKNQAHATGKYDSYHTLWHVVVSLGQTYLVLTTF
jgi:hypothetical protein